MRSARYDDEVRVTRGEDDLVCRREATVGRGASRRYEEKRKSRRSERNGSHGPNSSAFSTSDSPSSLVGTLA